MKQITPPSAKEELEYKTKALKEIWGLTQFDWWRMPEHLRKECRDMIAEIADKAIDFDKK